MCSLKFQRIFKKQMLKSFKWLQNQAEEFNTCESENNNLLNTEILMM